MFIFHPPWRFDNEQKKTLEPLREALAKGYRLGVLQSSEMGLNVYRKLGFQEYYKISMYLWMGDK